MLEFPTLPKYYTKLVDHVDRAITALDDCDPFRARMLLVAGLREAEEIYLEMASEVESCPEGE